MCISLHSNSMHQEATRVHAGGGNAIRYNSESLERDSLAPHDQHSVHLAKKIVGSIRDPSY